MDWNWLRAEYPFEQTIREKRNVILYISIFGSIIVFLLQPYGFSIIDQVIAFFCFLIMAIITLSINYFSFPYFFPKIFEETKWSISKAFLFFLYNFIIIGFYNHILNAIVIKKNVFFIHSETDLFAILFRSIAVGIVASFFLILIRYNFLARKHLQISQDLNGEFKSQLEFKMDTETNVNIELYLENSKVSFNRNDLKYISAEGNYITLHFRNDENKTPKLFRATLKQTEVLLQDFHEFFRCHRSYIINLNAVESSLGNSQGLSVKMFNEEIQIPVARPKIKSLKYHLVQINTL